DVHLALHYFPTRRSSELRLGLSDVIIDNAKELVGVDSKSVENMIASLEDSQIRAEQDYEAAHQTLLDAEALKHDLEKKWQQFEEDRKSTRLNSSHVSISY